MSPAPTLTNILKDLPEGTKIRIEQYDGLWQFRVTLGNKKDYGYIPIEMLKDVPFDAAVKIIEKLLTEIGVLQKRGWVCARCQNQNRENALRCSNCGGYFIECQSNPTL